MRKLLILIFTILSLGGYGQTRLELVNIGTGPGVGDGDPLRTAFIKTNSAINALDSLYGPGTAYIKFKGATSGTVRVDAEAVAGTNKLTAPAETGTLATRANVTTQVNDSLNAVRAAATVGVALADSGVYNGGYITPKMLDDAVFAGYTVGRMQFRVDVTQYAPAAGDSTFIQSTFEGKHLELYRDGVKQTQNPYVSPNPIPGFRFDNVGGEIVVNPPFVTKEDYIVEITPDAAWSVVNLEPQGQSLLTGLLFYAKLDESSGNAFDEKGPYEGTASNVTYNASGRIGRCFTFNGSNSGVDFGDIIAPTTAMSISLWFKATSTASSQAMIDKTEYDTEWAGYRVSITTGGYVSVGLYNGSGINISKQIGTGKDDGNWHHAVFTWDGSTVYTYIDNVKSTGSSYSQTITYMVTKLGIGYHAEYAYMYYDGDIDEVLIYNRALDDSEVTSLYNLTQPL